MIGYRYRTHEPVAPWARGLSLTDRPSSTGPVIKLGLRDA